MPRGAAENTAQCVCRVIALALAWLARGWRRSDNTEDVKYELWVVLLDLTDKHIMHYHWVKGHAENEYNNRCDELAVSEWKKLK